MKKLLTTLCAFALIAGVATKASFVNAEGYDDDYASGWAAASAEQDEKLSAEKEQKKKDEIANYLPEGGDEYQAGWDKASAELGEKNRKELTETFTAEGTDDYQANWEKASEELGDRFRKELADQMKPEGYGYEDQWAEAAAEVEKNKDAAKPAEKPAKEETTKPAGKVTEDDLNKLRPEGEDEYQANWEKASAEQDKKLADHKADVDSWKPEGYGHDDQWADAAAELDKKKETVKPSEKVEDSKEVKKEDKKDTASKETKKETAANTVVTKKVVAPSKVAVVNNTVVKEVPRTDVTK